MITAGQMTFNMVTDEQLAAFGRQIAEATWEAAKRFYEGHNKSDKMMTTKEVMDWYRCGRSSIYTKIENGELHPEKVGGKNLFRESEVKFHENKDLANGNNQKR